MNKVKIGRNDPCPCGSGKKYKKCCGRMEELVSFSLDPFERYSQLIMAVKIKLDQYYEKEIKKIRRETLQRFLTFSVDRLLPPEHESFFSDWLWFDNKSKNNRTLGESYLQANGDYMEPALKDCLNALNQSCLSVFELLNSQDNYMQLADIFSAKNYQVLLKEPFENDKKENGIILLGRLVVSPEGHLFSGMVLLLEDDAQQKDFIKEHFAYLQELNQTEGEKLLKYKGEIIYGLFDHANKKNFMNLRDIQAVSIIEEEGRAVLDALSANEDYVFVHETGGFRWYKPAGDNYGYVRIAVGKDFILCCADVLQDVSKLKNLLGSILADKEFTVVSSLFLQKPPSLEVSELWFTVIKDQETERWLTTPHQELDEKTPNEILEENDGQKRLMQLLEDFSHSVSGEEEQDLIEYMKMRIK